MTNFETLSSSAAINEEEGKALFLDYDGVLVDSFEEFIMVVSEITGIEPLSPEELNLIRGLTVLEIVRYLQLTPLQIFQLARYTRQKMASKADGIKMFPDVGELVKEVYDSGRGIYIVSSNSTSTIEDTINRYDLGSHITQIHGGVGILSKSNRLRRVMRSERLEVSNTLYVGDELRDVDAASKVDMDCISAAWGGYSTKAALESRNPGNVVSSPAELGEQLTSRGFLT